MIANINGTPKPINLNKVLKLLKLFLFFITVQYIHRLNKKQNIKHAIEEYSIKKAYIMHST